MLETIHPPAPAPVSPERVPHPGDRALWRLVLRWDHKRPGSAPSFASSLLAFLWPRCEGTILLDPNGKELELLELPTCLELIQSSPQATIGLRIRLWPEASTSTWHLHLNPEHAGPDTALALPPPLADTAPDVGWPTAWLELPDESIGANDLTDSSRLQAVIDLLQPVPDQLPLTPHVALDLLQPVPGQLPPTPLLALVRTGARLELATFNNIVGLAHAAGPLLHAALYRVPSSDDLQARSDDSPPLQVWLPVNGVSAARSTLHSPLNLISQEMDGSSVISLTSLGPAGLLVPLEVLPAGSGAVPVLRLQTAPETRDAPPADRAVLWKELPRVVRETLEAPQADFGVLESFLRRLQAGFPALRLAPLAGCQLPAFMTAPPAELCLAVIPEPDRITLALDRGQPLEVAVRLLLHGLGHVLLGHVRPGDEYGHWDTLESALGEMPLRRWDRQVRETWPDWVPSSRVTSLDECSPREKAFLGLWGIIRQFLGSGGRLHSAAEAYQLAAYQRQAAQRLLTMLDTFAGAMLCDGVGLGKTYVATTLLVHYVHEWRERHRKTPDRLLTDPFRITVVAPNSVVSTWQREAVAPLAAHGVPIDWIRIISHSRLSRISRNSEVLAREPESRLSDLEHLLLSDLVVIDEAHNFRAASARRTLVLRDLLRLQPRKEQRRRVLLLTATPINNSLADLEQEVSLLFSEPILLSDASTEEGYRNQARRTLEERCERARRHRSNEDVAGLIIHRGQGGSSGGFKPSARFRKGLLLGDSYDLGKYLKTQNDRLIALQEEIRSEAALGATPEHRQPVRIAAELLDRIVVQRSRALCKQIELQENSSVDLLFRPDPGRPERLHYADAYDGTSDVLAGFLPLFGETEEGAGQPPLSFKVYMWHDVRAGLKEADDATSAVGLQKVLALKRLESSPVSFLITLLRLTVLHAHRLYELYSLCLRTGDQRRANDLQTHFSGLLAKHRPNELRMLRWLSLGDDTPNPRERFFHKMSEAYADTPMLEPELASLQLTLFQDAELAETPEREQLERLWELQEVLLQDLDTLLEVTPRLARIIFGRFELSAWPGRFIADNAQRRWPDSREWGQRVSTDPKLRALVRRLLLARRRGQKVIVFSQFTDTLGYLDSVLAACKHFSPAEKEALLFDLELPEPDSGELDALLSAYAIVSGDTEDRDPIINAFAPYYRIGPFPPQDSGTEKDLLGRPLDHWTAAWTRAILEPVDVLLATDVLAEGVNLQDAAVLINFDIHWNPVRMIQRSGRIDRRLNPRIERTRELPELSVLADGLRAPLPTYYWHGHEREAPTIVNLILPDELEAELQLRERIATKTLAIDFTLGLEQGTGAEADWMEHYRYQGISSLNAFQQDRAIEQLASLRTALEQRLTERGIQDEWLGALNVWLREADGDDTTPLIGSAWIGRDGDRPACYTRCLEPRSIDGVPCWLWTVRIPTGTLGYSHWIQLDGEHFPPLIRDDVPPAPEASRPLQPEDVLAAVRKVLAEETQLRELDQEQVGTQVYQGITALSAGFFRDDDARAEIVCEQVFLLQLSGLPGPERVLEAGGASRSNPVRGISRSCSVCGHAPGMHKCCPRCQVSADGEEQIAKVFGFRTMQSGAGAAVPQTWCRRCRTEIHDSPDSDEELRIC